jgi:hypothetical protein
MKGTFLLISYKTRGGNTTFQIIPIFYIYKSNETEGVFTLHIMLIIFLRREHSNLFFILPLLITWYQKTDTSKKFMILLIILFIRHEKTDEKGDYLFLFLLLWVFDEKKTDQNNNEFNTNKIIIPFLLSLFLKGESIDTEKGKTETGSDQLSSYYLISFFYFSINVAIFDTGVYAVMPYICK